MAPPHPESPQTSPGASPEWGARFLATTQAAGVIASGWLVWFYIVLPQLGRHSLASLLGSALIYVSTAWICGGAITFCVYMVVSLVEMPDVIRFSVRSSAPAMWFAPAIILLSIPSPAAFVVSLVLVSHAARVLASLWVRMESPIHRLKPEGTGDTVPFHAAAGEGVSFSRDWATVLICSFTAQAGMVAMLWRHPLLAAVFLATSTAILTSLAIVTGAHRPGRLSALPSTILSVVVTFILAVALSFGGMVVRHGGGGAGSVVSSNPAAESGADQAKQIVTKTVSPPEASTELGGDFPGVILLPDLEPHTALVVPFAPSVSGVAPKRPAGIPFTGEYWMFRPPYTRPPARSIIRRGKPSEISFHTTDGAPMLMEARQTVDPPVDLTGCSAIQLAIADTDRSPGGVSVELILMDRDSFVDLSLGRAQAESGSSMEQTLNFPIPPGTSFRKFDQIKVIFHRDILLMDKSARIAIKRFVLLP
jgi:hypothetical protein